MQTFNIFNRALAVTTSDTVNLPELNGTKPTSIYIGGAGTLTVVFEDNTTAAFTCVAGQILPVRPKRINATGTAATLIVALYQV